ncbi:MAG: septum formation protein Maf [Candidatus Aminicenantes bacterium]|nr:septum formation protein Maf [Candidatus Aminicenantes bacterium]NIQ65190.1 septum formation protein Maf [Candidatus Aminicenantes bacterium]NIT21193.1 septum formation protein Maf [Candidatus Aminicenantes bacterium]
MKLETTFILASSSPRRKELLKLLGIEPRIIIPTVDESMKPGESIESFLRRVTISKGDSVYKEEFYDIPIISADTIVLCENRLIGKPVDRAEAFGFLRTLSDNVHEVWTGVSIRYRGTPYYDYARTRVVFAEISDQELHYYLDNEDYLDKAGAYAIQGRASVFVKKIDGCYFNVMGFPLNLFYNMLREIGIHIYQE